MGAPANVGLVARALRTGGSLRRAGQRLLEPALPPHGAQPVLPFERPMALLLVLAAVAFNLVFLWADVTRPVHDLNDNVFHFLNLQRASDAFAYGEDPTDSWQRQIALGYPVAHYYQHLPYVLPAVVHAMTRIDLLWLFRGTAYLLLSLFPISSYWAVRRLGFGYLEAGAAALASSVIAAPHLLGFELESYLWRGTGLYTQLWGMVLLGPTLAQAAHAIRFGRGIGMAAVLLAATALSHLVFGYIAIGSCALFVVTSPSPRDILLRVRRLAAVLALFAMMTAYFLLPLVQDSAYLNHSVWEAPYKTASYGAEWVFRSLANGNLFDYARFPILTTLVALGAFVCLVRSREERYRVALLLGVMWLLVFCGRPTWGSLFDLVPLAGDFHLHRLIAAVHIAGIFLIGIGLAFPVRWVATRVDVRLVALVGVASLALMWPVYRERLAFMQGNAALIQQDARAYAAQRADIDRIVQTLHNLPPGRVFAGLAGQWGRDYRVGSVTMEAFLDSAQLDTVGFLWFTLSLNGDVQVLFDESRIEHWNLFNIRYVVAPITRTLPEWVRPIAQFGGHRVYQVDTSGFFDIVRSDVAFEGDRSNWYQGASTWMRSGAPAAREYPTVIFPGNPRDIPQPILPMSAVASYVPPSTPAPRGTIHTESANRDTYSTTVDLAQPATLLFKMSYHPGWQAFVDGRRVEPRMLFPSYMGVALEAGRHDVRFTYASTTTRHLLLLVSAGTLLVLGGLEVRAWRERRRAVPASLDEAAPPLIAERATPGDADGVTDALRRRFAGVESVLDGYAARLTTPFARSALARRALVADGLLLVTVLAGLPTLSLRWMSGHDSLAYLPRHVEFFEGLRAGVLFPRWAPDLAWGYGEPTFNFNPPLLYYAAACFHAIGFDFVASEDLVIFTLLLLSAVGMFCLAREWFGTSGGIVSATAYVFSPFLLARLYVSHALADYAAFAFIPFAFWGLYRYCLGGRARFFVAGTAGPALVVLSSSAVALLAFPPLAGFVLWLWLTERRGAVLRRGIWCLLLAVGLTAFTWFPALAEEQFVHIARRAERIDYHGHFLTIQQLLWAPWGFGLAPDGMSFALGPVYLVMTAAAATSLRAIFAASRVAGRVVVFVLAMMLVALFFVNGASLPLWDRLTPLHPLQFPWRFLQLLAFGTSFLCGFPFLLIERRRRAVSGALLAAMLAALLAFGLPHAAPQGFLGIDERTYAPANITAGGLAATAREFEPIWVEQFPAKLPSARELVFVQGRGSVLASTLRAFEATYVIDVTQAGTARIETFDFPGWRLTVDDRERAITHANAAGLIEFAVTPGQHVVHLWFGSTPARQVATAATLLALGLLVVTAASLRRRGRVPSPRRAHRS